MKYKLCDGVSLENVEGNLILVMAQGDVAILNDTAGIIVKKIIEEPDNNIIDYLYKKYSIEKDNLRADTEELIMELRNVGFLEKI